MKLEARLLPLIIRLTIIDYYFTVNKPNYLTYQHS